MAEELVLLTRLFDLLAWLLPKAERFPKSYRFTVTQRMMDAALDCQEAVLSAQSQRGDARRGALRAADTDLNRLLHPSRIIGFERQSIPARQHSSCGDRQAARRLDQAVEQSRSVSLWIPGSALSGSPGMTLLYLL